MSRPVHSCPIKQEPEDVCISSPPLYQSSATEHTGSPTYNDQLLQNDSPTLCVKRSCDGSSQELLEKRRCGIVSSPLLQSILNPNDDDNLSGDTTVASRLLAYAAANCSRKVTPSSAPILKHILGQRDDSVFQCSNAGLVTPASTLLQNIMSAASRHSQESSASLSLHSNEYINTQDAGNHKSRKYRELHKLLCTTDYSPPHYLHRFNETLTDNHSQDSSKEKTQNDSYLPADETLLSDNVLSKTKHKAEDESKSTKFSLLSTLLHSQPINGRSESGDAGISTQFMLQEDNNKAEMTSLECVLCNCKFSTQEALFLHSTSLQCVKDPQPTGVTTSEASTTKLDSSVVMEKYHSVITPADSLNCPHCAAQFVTKDSYQSHSTMCSAARTDSGTEALNMSPSKPISSPQTSVLQTPDIQILNTFSIKQTVEGGTIPTKTERTKLQPSTTFGLSTLYGKKKTEFCLGESPASMDGMSSETAGTGNKVHGKSALQTLLETPVPKDEDSKSMLEILQSCVRDRSYCKNCRLVFSNLSELQSHLCSQPTSPQQVQMIRRPCGYNLRKKLPVKTASPPQSENSDIDESTFTAITSNETAKDHFNSTITPGRLSTEAAPASYLLNHLLSDVSRSFSQQDSQSANNLMMSDYEKPSGSRLMVTCKKCMRVYHRGSAFRNHQKSCLAMGMIRELPKVPILHCEYCSDIFPSYSSLANHKKACAALKPTAVPTEAIFTCCHCGWTSKRSSSFTYHMKTCSLANSSTASDLDSDSLRCDICKCTFKTVQEMMEHRRNLSCVHE